MRYLVQALVETLAAGMNVQEVLADYPNLQREYRLAALEFAALAVGDQRVVLLGAT